VKVLIISSTGYQFWKTDNIKPKTKLRINVSAERKHVINDICSVLSVLYELKDPELGQLITLDLALALESAGEFRRSLAYLSELISAEADKVDLAFVILRAASKLISKFQPLAYL
jgi:hypothetical protein